ncbi:hypothetical protein [Lactiplantibacillus garii]|nr:hypothetical protein [Lactiplantibacillus garii]
MLRELENPDHALQVTDINTLKRITFEKRMPVDVPGPKDNYYLQFKNGAKQLIFFKKGNHFNLTLMHHVKSFHCDVHHNLSVETERGERFTAKLLIPDKGEVTDETAIGNHAAISH